MYVVERQSDTELRNRKFKMSRKSTVLLFSILVLFSTDFARPETASNVPKPNNDIQQELVGKKLKGKWCGRVKNWNGNWDDRECFRRILKLSDDGRWRGSDKPVWGKRVNFRGTYWFNDSNLCKSDNFSRKCWEVRKEGEYFYFTRRSKTVFRMKIVK